MKNFWQGFYKRAEDVTTPTAAAATSIRNAFGSQQAGPGIISRVGSALSNAFSGPSLASAITSNIRTLKGQ